MNFTRLEIPDVILCQPQVFGDDRGYFIEAFRQDRLDEFLGYNIPFCQDNESNSTFGVLRGLHYQLAPHAQTKLVRIIKGVVLDVAVDLRSNSLTYGRHCSIVISDKNFKSFYIPKGFAHGFIVLSKSAIFSYKVDNYYNPDSESGVLWCDLDLNIDWKINKNEIIVSEKDKNLPTFNEIINPF